VLKYRVEEAKRGVFTIEFVIPIRN
jgi:hypothetical protein